MKKNKPILSISILASDRLDTLPRCLDSLTPIREAIPCELIIVDTSKNPKVHELILKYADKVDTFEWCHDFAKARNVGVRMAEGEWFMFMDDDEWFAEPEELIEFFRSGEYRDYDFANHRIKNFHDVDFTIYGYGWVTRLTKLSPETAFYGKIHEYMAPLEGECKVLYATSYHSGYVYRTEEEHRAHFERNVSLLERVEKEEPNELRWKKQMLQEYWAINDWTGMAEYGKKALDYLWSTSGTVDAISFGSIHIGYAIALYQSKQYELVEGVYKRARPVVEKTVVAKAYMELWMAQSYWAMEQYQKAKYHAQKYIEGYEIYSKDIDAYHAETVTIFLSEAFDDDWISNAYSMILSAELQSGNDAALYTLYSKLKWNENFINNCNDIEVYILDCLVRIHDYEMLERVLQDTLSVKVVRPRMMKAILDWRKKDNERFIEILETVKKLDIQSWYKQYAALLTLDEEVTREEVLLTGKKFVELVPNIFIIPSEITEILAKYDIKPADLYLYIDFDRWKRELKDRLEGSTMEQVEELQKQLEDSLLVQDIRYHYFMMIYTEQKAMLAQKESMSFDELTEWLTLLSEHTCICYEEMYGEQLQEAEVEEWPVKYQAAKWIQMYLAEVGNDMKLALGCLAKVIGVYPRLADVMRYYLERIQIEILNA